MTTPTEALTVERLIRTACQVAHVETHHCRRAACADGVASEDAGCDAVQALLTPAARLSLIADLAAGLPGWCSGNLGLRGPEAVALIAGLPSARPERYVHVDETAVGYSANIGRLSIIATERRAPSVDEREALAAAPKRAESCLLLPAAHPLTEGISSAVMP